MPKFLWASPEEAEREWKFAKDQLIQDNKLLPNGTKLRRNDHQKNLNHSFLITDDRIIALSGKGIYLSRQGISSVYANTKLAEDEKGNLFVLKIIKKKNMDPKSIRSDVRADSPADEAIAAQDFGIAGNLTTRQNTLYILYQYLGISLEKYFEDKGRRLSLDKCYELSIKISLALYAIHSGKKAQSKRRYKHGDIHSKNIVIDDQDQPHFIDFGKATRILLNYLLNDRDNYLLNYSDDIQEMLRLFLYKEQHNKVSGIFADWRMEYDFYFGQNETVDDEYKPTYDEKNQRYKLRKHRVYLYFDPSDVRDECYHSVRYMVEDLKANCQYHGLIKIDNLGFVKLPKVGGSGIHDLSEQDESSLKKMILTEASRNSHIVINNENEVLFNMLNNPTETADTHTALDIAETLTLCRFKLEAYRNSFRGLSEDIRLQAIHALNSTSTKIFALYEQLQALPNHSDIAAFIKQCIVAHPDRKNDFSADTLNQQFPMLSEDDARSLKQKLTDIITSMDASQKAGLTSEIGIFAQKNNTGVVEKNNPHNRSNQMK